MVEAVNGGDNSTNSENTNSNKGPPTSTKGWNTTWLGMPNTILVGTQKFHEVVNSQGKLIIVEELFLDISK